MKGVYIGPPTEEDFEIIKNWPAEDYQGLMTFVMNRWMYADIGYWEQEGEIYLISTGGWSDNEILIHYMKRNMIFWALYWYQSRRGGHYVFGPMKHEIMDALHEAARR